MSFDEEPEWMKKARTVPLRSTWESRQRDNKDAPLRKEAPIKAT